MNVTPAAFDILVREAVAAGANPHDWALMIYEESTWNPAIQNRHGAKYYGLNQMGIDEAISVGFKRRFPDEWLKLSTEAQLPYVARFFRQKAQAIRPNIVFASAAHMLAANFLPARVRKTDALDIDYPLCKQGELGKDHKLTKYYESNRPFDVHPNGDITIRDLGEYLAQYRRANPRDTAALVLGVNQAAERAGLAARVPKDATLLPTPPASV